MPEMQLEIHESIEQLIESASEISLKLLKKSTCDRQIRIALAGGSTPRRLHQVLAREQGIDWSNIHIYFGDERTVDHDHPDSNYFMAYETLLESLDIPGAQVHRMRGEIEPVVAAQEYEETLRRTFDLDSSNVPMFDLMFLGMGADGHTASLFPGTEALTERTRFCVANYVPQLETHRITLTYPVLNSARNIIFMAAGSDKSAALRAVLESHGDDVPPAGLVRPPDGNLYWLVDRAAASELTESTK